jgi:tRNA (uracil-5-)-methyltransferase TRM9
MDLLKLNEQFYLKTQAYFNRSRQSPWPGWQKLLPYLLQVRNLKCLDLGCGNGRFGVWLKQHRQIDYTGLDNNQYLLDAAAKKLPGAYLIHADLTKSWPIKNKFDLIVLMAVLHHIPTKPARLKILLRAKKLLAKNGLLVFTVWHFNKLKRFQNQVIKKFPGNDYILNWKKGVIAQRYIHLFTDAEINWLIKNLKLKLLADFVADGRLGQSNRYIVLKQSTYTLPGGVGFFG